MNLFDLPIEIDPSLPEGTIEIRDDNDNLLAKIINIGIEPLSSNPPKQ